MYWYVIGGWQVERTYGWHVSFSNNDINRMVQGNEKLFTKMHYFIQLIIFHIKKFMFSTLVAQRVAI